MGANILAIMQATHGVAISLFVLLVTDRIKKPSKHSVELHKTLCRWQQHVDGKRWHTYETHGDLHKELSYTSMLHIAAVGWFDHSYNAQSSSAMCVCRLFKSFFEQVLDVCCMCVFLSWGLMSEQKVSEEKETLGNGERAKT